MPTYLDDDFGLDWHHRLASGYRLPEIGARCVVWNTGTVSRAIRVSRGDKTFFYECDEQWHYNGFVLRAVTKWRLPREGE